MKLIRTLLPVLLWSVTPVHAESDDGPQRPTTRLDLTPGAVTICQMGPITLRVPNEYRPACYAAKEPGGEAGLMFWAMLPNLSPLTDLRYNAFDNPNKHDQVYATISYDNGPVPGPKLLKIYTDNIIKGQIKKKSGQYETYVMNPNYYRLLYINKLSDPHFFNCIDPEDPAFKGWKIECQVTDDLNTDIIDEEHHRFTVQYTLSGDYVESIPHIDAMMKTLISSFEQLPDKNKP